jgi:hypothetical protein
MPTEDAAIDGNPNIFSGRVRLEFFPGDDFSVGHFEEYE